MLRRFKVLTFVIICKIFSKFQKDNYLHHEDKPMAEETKRFSFGESTEFVTRDS